MDMSTAGRRCWPPLLRTLPLWLCWCVVPAAGASGAAPAAAADIAAITTISLERDCNGCASGTLLLLRRDGTAVLTATGKARLGTADRVSSGVVPAVEFDRLARLLLVQGYFSMEEVYEAPGLQDGAWTTLAVTRGGQDKRVFSRDDAGPAALRALQSAIDALQARIAFAPAPR